MRWRTQSDNPGFNYDGSAEIPVGDQFWRVSEDAVEVLRGQTGGTVAAWPEDRDTGLPYRLDALVGMTEATVPDSFRSVAYMLVMEMQYGSAGDKVDLDMIMESLLADYISIPETADDVDGED